MAVYIGLENISCINPRFDVYEDIIKFVQKLIDVHMHQVGIINPFDINYDPEIKKSLELSEIVYTLWMISCTKENSNKWDGKIYSYPENNISA